MELVSFAKAAPLLVARKHRYGKSILWIRAPCPFIAVTFVRVPPPFPECSLPALAAVRHYVASISQTCCTSLNYAARVARKHDHWASRLWIVHMARSLRKSSYKYLVLPPRLRRRPFKSPQ